MADLNVEIPGFLAKHGIKSVSDNVPAGHRIQAPAGLFFTLFREEIMDRCSNRKEVSNDLPAS